MDAHLVVCVWIGSSPEHGFVIFDFLFYIGFLVNCAHLCTLVLFYLCNDIGFIVFIVFFGLPLFVLLKLVDVVILFVIIE